MDYSARWYSPSVGRFTSQDTWSGDTSNPQTLNRYAYAMNNPLNISDLSGHMPCYNSNDGSLICGYNPNPDNGGTSDSGGGSSYGGDGNGSYGGDGGYTGSGSGDTGGGSDGSGDGGITPPSTPWWMDSQVREQNLLQAAGLSPQARYSYQYLSAQEECDGCTEYNLPTGDGNGSGSLSKFVSSIVDNAKSLWNNFTQSTSRLYDLITGKAPEVANDPAPKVPTPSSEGAKGPGSSGNSPQDEPGNSEGTGNIKFSPSNISKDPQELVKNGWEDVTPYGMAKNTTSREYIDPETGMKVRFDPGSRGQMVLKEKTIITCTIPMGLQKQIIILMLIATLLQKVQKHPTSYHRRRLQLNQLNCYILTTCTIAL